MSDERYVAGFLFDGSGRVLLVLKQRPSWQKWLWNGVGGKIEPGEMPDVAMVREFREEVGLFMPTWRHFATEQGNGYTVYFYTAHTEHEMQIVRATNDVGEELNWWPVRGIDTEIAMVGNLRWLIPLALDWRRGDVPLFRFTDNIKERPTW